MRNVTDVDDDILRKARELGVYYLDLAAEETARFDADMDALGLLQPFSEPRATWAIHDILGFIGMVLDNGHAYQAAGAVYFNVDTFERFGEISHLSRKEMLSLAGERGGNPDDPAKRDPLDFVLWQPSAPDEPPGHEPARQSMVATMPFWKQMLIGSALGVPIGLLLSLVVIAVMKLLHRP